jgi:hypothetical protein
MLTRKVSLTAEQDAFGEKVVKGGEYPNASEAYSRCAALDEFIEGLTVPPAKGSG